MPVRSTPPPPELLRVAAHPLRWSLLVELADGDRSVRELCAATGREQSLVSYHLGRLRSAGLATARRSSADGRDSYYRLDLHRCRSLLAATGAAIHPGLAEPGPPAMRPSRPVRVLFLCTGNSGRSPMAEALLRARCGEAVVVSSAGSQPKPMHPDAIAVLADRGIDLSTQPPRHLHDVAEQRWDVVVTLCDRVREVCPELPGTMRRIHWSTPDPSAADSAPTTRAAFEQLLTDLDDRIEFLVPLLAEPTPPIGDHP